MRLADRVAIITGAGGGIGAATAETFAGAGAIVAVLDVNESAAGAVAKALTDKGATARAYPVDVTQKRAVDEVVAHVLKDCGRVDILVNNAGINRDAMLRKLTEEDWDAVIDVNLKGTFLMGQAVAGPMVERVSGRIINTASIGALGNVGQSNYAASKAGVIGLTWTWALELARYKINVNCVAPGATTTPMTARVPPELVEKLTQRIPFRRFAEPAEIARVHLFLASDDASYITGQVLFVDGGLSVGF